MADDRPRKHIFIPDVQIRPGVPTDHIEWMAQWVVEQKPDVIVIAGDWFDFPSLNSHVEKGSIPLEGLRYKDDLDAGNEAFRRFCAPIDAEIKRVRDNRKRAWNPRRIVTIGNHEIRADRVAQNDPKLFGSIGSDQCDFRDYERFPFLEIAEADGILYSHFFKMQNSNNAIGGSTDNRLNKIGRTHVQGHQVGFLYGNRVYPDGKTRHSVTAGSAYLHQEDYRGPQCNAHFRGLIQMNEVRDGDFCIMPISLDFLARKFEGERLHRYMTLKYAYSDWSHLQ